MTQSWRTGLGAFRFVAAGQIASSLGNEISAFAFTIWAFEKTGSVGALGLLLFFNIIPYLIVLPFAGVIVDRVDRRWLMMLSDLVNFVVTALFLLLSLAGALEVWHLYAGVVVIGAAYAFQEPAFVSAMGSMLKPDEFPKASGALGLVDATRALGGPALGAILYPAIGLSGVIIVDLLTFIPALLTLLLIHIPPHDPSKVKRQLRWLEETTFGFKYIFKRTHMVLLILCSALFNLAWGISQAMQPALILARSDETTLAVVRTVTGIGGLIAGLAISTWGAPKPRIVGVIASIAVYGASLALTGIGTEVIVWSAATFVGMLVFPLLGASTGAIWMRKSDPAIQGRLLAARRLVIFGATPIGSLLAGPLGDGWLKGAMQPGGALANTFGWLVGVGSGSGFALALVFAGVFQLGIAASALLNPLVRNVERIEPDYVPPESEQITGEARAA